MTGLALTTHRFIGLSTDSKPTGVPTGSTFLEYDTNTLFITYDGTNWEPREAGRIITKLVTLTRPADTTAYTALDAISDHTSTPTILTFSGVVRASGGSGYITKARIMTSQKACVARFRLHLYQSTPTPVNDNAAFPLLIANNAIRLGSITFPAVATEDPTSSTGAAAKAVPDGMDLPLAIKAAAGTTSIMGALQAVTAFTPDSAQTFEIELTVELS